VAAGALAALTLAGCSEDEPPPPELQPLSLAEQASSIVRVADGYQVNWAGVLLNRNPWHFGEHVVAVVVARDDKGAEVSRMEQPLDAVPPAGSLPFAGHLIAARKPARVTIHHRPAEWRPAARIPSAFKPFPVSEVHTERQKNGSYLITGQVANPFLRPAKSLVVTGLVRDRSGRLLGGGSTFVDDVPADRKARFILTLDGIDRSAKTGRTDVVVRTWGSTSRPYEELALGGAQPVHTVKPSTSPFARDRGKQALAPREVPR
jgi:hypothetical protein